MSVLIGMIGYILNLIFPNFEWENVTILSMQSLPAILTALIGVVVTCGTAYLLLRFFPSALFMGSWLAMCNYSIAAFNNGGVGGQKRSALISRIIERYLFIAKRCKVMIQKWILCPVCGSKTRVRIREDTVLENFPLYCPKCKHETLISARQLNISVIKEPDAQTQSQ